MRSKQIFQQLQAELENGYSWEEPMVIQNPYQVSPLTAVIIFDTKEECAVRFTVKGKTEAADISGEVESAASHRIPVIGLYPAMENTVVLELLDKSGKVTDSQEITITTDELPDKLDDAVKPVKTSGESAFELTMVYGQRTTFPFAYDCMGDIRWYMSGEFTSGIYMLSNSIASVEKRFGGDRHNLALTILGAPTERGAQQASTQEAYDLLSNNYYNPNVGKQDGKLRNSRVRDYHEPIVMLNYGFDISSNTKLAAAASFRFGKNGYSALTWTDGPDPRPDYYRYLPSYFALDKNYVGAAWQQVYWQANYQNIRHFDWEQMYQTNYNQNDPLDEQIYGPGRRSNYMVEERHTDQLALYRPWRPTRRHYSLSGKGNRMSR